MDGLSIQLDFNWDYESIRSGHQFRRRLEKCGSPPAPPHSAQAKVPTNTPPPGSESDSDGGIKEWSNRRSSSSSRGGRRSGQAGIGVRYQEYRSHMPYTYIHTPTIHACIGPSLSRQARPMERKRIGFDIENDVLRTSVPFMQLEHSMCVRPHPYPSFCSLLTKDRNCRMAEFSFPICVRSSFFVCTFSLVPDVA
jgi:hypothetical protein